MGYFETTLETYYQKGDYIAINKKLITHITTSINDSDGYVYKKTYVINVYVIGSNEVIRLKTYDKETFEKWLEELKEE